MCEYNPKISVALEITADLPSSEELQRWLGEPVRVRSNCSQAFPHVNGQQLMCLLLQSGRDPAYGYISDEP